MMTYYNLATVVERRGDCHWPYVIDICFDAVPCPVGLTEGIGQGVGATTVSAEEALSATWRKHFEAAHALWLLPYLRDLANGKPLPGEEMLRTYRIIHGREAEVSRYWP